MNTLSSLSVFSSYTEEVLLKNYFAKIHSVFPNGFNLKTKNDLIYVSYHQEGMLSATGFSIDQSVFEQLHPHLQEGLRVRLRENQLTFYTRPHVFTVNLIDKQIKSLRVIPMKREELEDFGFSSHLKHLNLLENSGFSDNEGLMEILQEIQTKREITVNQVKRLIGAGIGLTPTGDDFLQGIVLMEQTLKHEARLQMMVEEQLKNRSTTEVSMSYFQALFNGYSNEPLVLLFDAVKAKDNKKFKQAVGYLKNYGSTSGYDLMTGMYTYLQINEEWKVNL